MRLLLCLLLLCKQIICACVCLERAKHSFFALPNPLSCSVMNKICLNQKENLQTKPLCIDHFFTLLIILADAQAIIKVSDHQHRWVARGYDLEIGHFQRWLAW